MKQIILTLLIALSGVAINSAHAAKYWESCDSCTSTKMKRAAKNAIPNNSNNGLNYVYVMDYDNANIKKFKVTVANEPEDGTYLVFVRSMSIESNVVSDFKTLVGNLKHIEGQLKADIEIPAYISPSAFDMMRNSSMRNNISSHIWQNLSVWQNTAIITTIPLTATNKITGLHLRFEVSFSDGSTADFWMTGAKGNDAVTFEFTRSSQPGCVDISPPADLQC